MVGMALQRRYRRQNLTLYPGRPTLSTFHAALAPRPTSARASALDLFVRRLGRRNQPCPRRDALVSGNIAGLRRYVLSNPTGRGAKPPSGGYPAAATEPSVSSLLA